MSWILVLQLVILMVIGALLYEAVHCAIIDKRREDDIKRKEAGLWPRE